MKIAYILLVLIVEPFTKHFLDREDEPGMMRTDHYRRY